MAKGVDFLLRKNKATVFKGYGTVVTPNKIVVKGDGVSTEVNAKNIILATGSEAKSLPGYNFDENYILSNVGALDLAEVPKSMLIVGSGAVGVEKSGVTTDRGFIKVNEFMETNVKGVYAIGDVTPSPLLAHVAQQEGIVAVERIADKHPVPINYNHVPSSTYCDPQVASVG